MGLDGGGDDGGVPSPIAGAEGATVPQPWRWLQLGVTRTLLLITHCPRLLAGANCTVGLGPTPGAVRTRSQVPAMGQ